MYIKTTIKINAKSCGKLNWSSTDKDAEFKGNFVYMDNKCNLLRAKAEKKTSVTVWVFMIVSPGDALSQTLVNHTQ